MLTSLLLVATLGAGAPQADAPTDALPQGWVMPQPLERKAVASIPACCATSFTCCARETEVARARSRSGFAELRRVDVESVPWADPPSEPELDDLPQLLSADWENAGAPLERLQLKANSTVGLLGPGRAGIVTIEDHTGFDSTRGYVRFASGIGGGLAFRWGSADFPLVMTFHYHSVEPELRDGERVLRVRQGRATVDRSSGELTVIEHLEATAVDVYDGVVFAYRSLDPPADETSSEPREMLHLVMPVVRSVFDHDSYRHVALPLGEHSAGQVLQREVRDVLHHWRDIGVDATRAFDRDESLLVSTARDDGDAYIMVGTLRDDSPFAAF